MAKVCIWDPSLDVWLLKDPDRLKDCFVDDGDVAANISKQELADHFIEPRQGYLLASVPAVLRAAGVQMDGESWGLILPDGGGVLG